MFGHVEKACSNIISPIRDGAERLAPVAVEEGEKL